jgi:acyl carrier protein
MKYNENELYEIVRDGIVEVNYNNKNRVSREEISRQADISRYIDSLSYLDLQMYLEEKALEKYKTRIDLSDLDPEKVKTVDDLVRALSEKLGSKK